MDAAAVPCRPRCVLTWKNRKQALTADGHTWFSILTITDGNHTPLSVAAFVGNRPHLFQSVWLHSDTPTERALDACARALNILHLDNKLDLIGAEVPDNDALAALHMDFVPQLRCRDAVTGAWSSFCIRRPPRNDAPLVLICTVSWQQPRQYRSI